MTTKQEERHKYLDLCIPYAFGRLNPGNRKQFEAHLASGCKVCKAELARLNEALGLFPLTLKQERPDQRVKEQLLARIASAKRTPGPAQEQPRRALKKEAPVTMATGPVVTTQRPWFGYAIAGVALLIIVALGIYTNDLITTLDTQEQKIVALQTELAQRDEMLKILQSQRIEMVLMNGLEPSPSGYGKIIWDPVKKTAIFQVAQLPTVPEDKEYQLWVIRKGEKIPAGLFAVRSEQEKESYFKIMNLNVESKKDFEAFAVTLEPKGGSPQPTSPIYLLGTTSLN
jgi:anti-sigma-K factor RskA